MNEHVLTAAIDTYGVRNQMAMAQEEVAELIEALAVMRRDTMTGYRMVIEEIADVLVMLCQIELMIDARQKIRDLAATVPAESILCDPFAPLAALIQAISKFLRGKRSGRARVIEKSAVVTALVEHLAAELDVDNQIARTIDFKIDRLAGKISRYRLKAAA